MGQEWTVTLGNVYMGFVPVSWDVFPYSLQEVKMAAF